jgi:hypothetical protein
MKGVRWITCVTSSIRLSVQDNSSKRVVLSPTTLSGLSWVDRVAILFSLLGDADWFHAHHEIALGVHLDALHSELAESAVSTQGFRQNLGNIVMLDDQCC